MPFVQRPLPTPRKYPVPRVCLRVTEDRDASPAPRNRAASTIPWLLPRSFAATCRVPGHPIPCPAQFTSRNARSSRLLTRQPPAGRIGIPIPALVRPSELMVDMKAIAVESSRAFVIDAHVAGSTIPHSSKCRSMRRRLSALKGEIDDHHLLKCFIEFHHSEGEVSRIGI